MPDRDDRVGVPRDHRGPAIELVDGQFFYLLSPQPDDIQIGHIAHATAHLCRFTGHVQRFYSVAQHCVLVSHLVPPEHALWGLLHDATEAYIGDVSRPLKDALEGLAPGVLRGIEGTIARAIADRYGLAWPMPPEVKVADHVALATEQRDLMVGAVAPTMSRNRWPDMPDPHPDPITGWSPDVAAEEFLARFGDLWEGW